MSGTMQVCLEPGLGVMSHNLCELEYKQQVSIKISHAQWSAFCLLCDSPC